ncbi:hypothetical protein RRF57_001366 [Xylaria bambusicola]|uniref:Uncharacterized protein n=1 Tax=Xylaria bambusicola TaxID=326684 RepID=A0AAN7UGJ3_9PEZI
MTITITVGMTIGMPVSITVRMRTVHDGDGLKLNVFVIARVAYHSKRSESCNRLTNLDQTTKAHMQAPTALIYPFSSSASPNYPLPCASTGPYTTKVGLVWQGGDIVKTSGLPH